jgi:hypothetical protein
LLLLFLIPPPGSEIAREATAEAVWVKSVAPDKTQCRKVTLSGEVAAGQEWNSAFGEGWVFRVIPILGKEYSGWDLVVDRDKGGGYPDALLVATPPYGSLNEREIGTTFGMRAQDAIAWWPRRFHFLTSTADLARGRELFRTVTAGDKMAREKETAATAELLTLIDSDRERSSGEFKILDAKLTPGAADPPLFAQQWTARLGQVPHTIVPAKGAASARGELLEIRFVVTLWLPERWKTPAGLGSLAASCAE